MMFYKRVMMHLPLVYKALPFLIHMTICLTSQLPGKPAVLYLLLLIAYFSVYCGEIIQILRLCLPQVCKKEKKKRCHARRAISYPDD